MIKTEASVLELDKKLDFLVKKIELLNYINPLNIQTEKKKFFDSKFTVNPKFKYPILDFDAFGLQRELFSLKIEHIEDKVIRDLYEDIIYEYSGLIERVAF